MPDLSDVNSRAEVSRRAAEAYGIVKEYMEASSPAHPEAIFPGEEKSAREAILNLSWWASHGSNAASGLLRMLTGEPHALAAEAGEIWERRELFSELARTEDPVVFAQKLDGYLDGVTQGLLQRFREGPSGYEGIRRYAEALQYGPASFILRLFERQFAQRLESREPRDEIVHLIRHDYLNPIISSTMLFMFWDRDLSVEALDRLGALERLRGPGRELLTHAAKALFPRSLGPAVQQTELGIELPVGLCYREGLALGEVEQVLVELVHNALKYADHHKENRFVLLSWEESLRALVVSDNGSGIKDPSRIWEAGAREALRHPGIEGSGLGLYSVRERVKRLGWEIDALSKVNVGTRFVIRPAEGDVIASPSTIDPLLAARVGPSPNTAAAAAVLSAALFSGAMLRPLH